MPDQIPEPIPPAAAAPWGWIALGAFLVAMLIVGLGRFFQSKKSANIPPSLRVTVPPQPPEIPKEFTESSIRQVQEKRESSFEKVVEKQRSDSDKLVNSPDDLNDFLKNVSEDFRK